MNTLYDTHIPLEGRVRRHAFKTVFNGAGICLHGRTTRRFILKIFESNFKNLVLESPGCRWSCGEELAGCAGQENYASITQLSSILSL